MKRLVLNGAAPAASSSSSSSSWALAIVVALGCLSAVGQCKPAVGNRLQVVDARNRDPLIALPNEHLVYQPQPQESPARQQVHYIVREESASQQPQPADASQYAEQQQQQPQQPRQEIQYVLVKSDEAAAHQPDTPVEEDCNQRDRQPAEYGAALAGEARHQAAGNEPAGHEQRQSEYPGEIVYVSPNGDARYAPEGAREQESLANVVAETSGVPATILTEVPAKDMPYEVLEKLKRDYGVKVVATRERPGANLVINCEDYTGAGQSICARQSPPQQQVHNGAGGSPYAMMPVADEGHSSGEPAAEFLEQPAGAYGLEHLEREQPASADYLRADGHEHASNAAPDSEHAPPTSSGAPHHYHRESFNSRQYAGAEQANASPAHQPDRSEENLGGGAGPAEAAANSEHERPEAEARYNHEHEHEHEHEQEHQQQQHHHHHHHHHQPEHEAQDAGFDAQPEASSDSASESKQAAADKHSAGATAAAAQ